jgi:hypothetical protein
MKYTAKVRSSTAVETYTANVCSSVAVHSQGAQQYSNAAVEQYQQRYATVLQGSSRAVHSKGVQLQQQQQQRQQHYSTTATHSKGVQQDSSSSSSSPSLAVCWPHTCGVGARAVSATCCQPCLRMPVPHQFGAGWQPWSNMVKIGQCAQIRLAIDSQMLCQCAASTAALP